MSSVRFTSNRYSPLPSNYDENDKLDPSLDNSEDSISKYSPKRSWWHLPWLLLGAVVAITLLSGLVGFGIGITAAQNRSSIDQIQEVVPQGNIPFWCHLPATDSSQVPIDHIIKTFKINQSFVGRPTKGKPEPVWDTLIPSLCSYRQSRKPGWLWYSRSGLRTKRASLRSQPDSYKLNTSAPLSRKLLLKASFRPG